MNRFFLACAALVGLVVGLALQPAPVEAQAPVRMSTTSPDVVSFGATGDAAATAGSTGTMQAKFRTMSGDLGGSNGIKENTEAIETAIEAIQTELVFAPCADGTLTESININLSAGTGNTEIQALESGVRIYVCGWKLIAGGAAVIKWIYGTGSACATGEQPRATLRAFAAGDGEAVGNSDGVVFTAPVSNALCVDRDTSVTLDGHVTIARVTP